MTTDFRSIGEADWSPTLRVKDSSEGLRLGSSLGSLPWL